MGKKLNSPATAAPAWKEDTYQALKDLEIRQVVYVPDAGHARLIELSLADPEMAAGPLANEFEGVGMCVGAWLGGQRSVLLMQSSGAANILNALGLVRSCHCPFFTLVMMRGDWGEFNPWQVPMGQAVPDILKAAGMVVNLVAEPDRVAEVVASSGRLAFHSYAPVAVLISQRVTGAKVFR